MGLLDQVLGQVLGGMTGGGQGRGMPHQAPQGGGLGGALGGGLPGGLGGLLGGAKGPIALAILAMLANKHLGSGAGGYGSVLRDMLGGGGAAGRAPDDRGFDQGSQDHARQDNARQGGGGILDGLSGMLGGGGSQPSVQGGATPAGSGGMGGLGGALGGGMLGGALGGGLGDLLERFRQGGHGDVAESWVGSGPNRRIEPRDLESALGSGEIDGLARETGMGRDELLSGLSDALPDVVDRLTPNGRLPTEDETTHWV